MTEKINRINCPKIITLHSQKGGVGKTSVALAIAGLLAFKYKQKVLIIDADLTGSSLIDVSGVKKDPDKKLFNDLLLAKPPQFLKYTPFLEDGIHTEDEGGNKGVTTNNLFDTFCYDVENTGGKISLMPGSPIHREIQKVIPLISQEDHLSFFKHRLEDIVTTAVVSGYKTVIIDHSPGLFGLSKSSLSIVLRQALSRLNNDKHPHGPTRLDRLYRSSTGDASGRVYSQAIFVTTPDKVDYRSLLPSLSYLLQEKDMLKKIDDLQGTLDILFNKAPRSYDSLLGLPDIYDDVEDLKDDRVVHSEVIEFMKKRTKSIGADAGEMIDDFKIDEIISITKNMSNVPEFDSSPWGKWCKHIDKIISIGNPLHDNPKS